MTADFKLYSVTWNVAGSSPPNDLNKLLGLDEKQLPDLYAIGLQELKSDTTTLISDSLFDDPWTTSITDELCQRGFVRVKSLRLVGIHLSVYVKRSQLFNIASVESEYTRTGFGGLWGSKGGVSVRLNIFGVNLCIVNSHFSAHTENYAQRIEDYNQVLLTQKFRDIDCSNILDHDYVFWLGDLNFRLDDLQNDEARSKVKERKYEELLNHDQLNKARHENLIFLNFEEGKINFPPTFKYDINSNEYDSSTKNRVPAWCDRILWRVHNDAFEGVELSLQQNRYEALEQYLESDHKPVVAEFTIKVLKKPVEQPVMFEPLDHWSKGKDQKVVYVISKSFPTSSRDWVGMYPVSFKNFEEYSTYTWIPTRGIDNEDGTYLCSVVFEGRDISGVKNGLYKLLYFSAAKNCVVGYSDDFELLGRDEATLSEEEQPVAEADVDGLCTRKVTPDIQPLPHRDVDVLQTGVSLAVQVAKSSEDETEANNGESFPVRGEVAVELAQVRSEEALGVGLAGVPNRNGEEENNLEVACDGGPETRSTSHLVEILDDVSTAEVMEAERSIRVVNNEELPVEDKNPVPGIIGVSKGTSGQVHKAENLLKEPPSSVTEDVVIAKKESSVELFEDSYLQLREDALARKEDETKDDEVVSSKLESSLEADRDVIEKDFMVEVENALLKENMSDFIASLDDLEGPGNSEFVTAKLAIETKSVLDGVLPSKVEEPVIAKKEADLYVLENRDESGKVEAGQDETSAPTPLSDAMELQQEVRSASEVSLQKVEPEPSVVTTLEEKYNKDIINQELERVHESTSIVGPPAAVGALQTESGILPASTTRRPGGDRDDFRQQVLSGEKFDQQHVGKIQSQENLVECQEAKLLDDMIESSGEIIPVQIESCEEVALKEEKISGVGEDFLIDSKLSDTESNKDVSIEAKEVESQTHSERTQSSSSEFEIIPLPTKHSDLESFEDSYLSLRGDALRAKESQDAIGGENIEKSVTESGLSATGSDLIDAEFVTSINAELLEQNIRGLEESLEDVGELLSKSDKDNAILATTTTASTDEKEAVQKEDEICVAKKEGVVFEEDDLSKINLIQSLRETGIDDLNIGTEKVEDFVNNIVTSAVQEATDSYFADIRSTSEGKEVFHPGLSHDISVSSLSEQQRFDEQREQELVRDENAGMLSEELCSEESLPESVVDSKVDKFLQREPQSMDMKSVEILPQMHALVGDAKPEVQSQSLHQDELQTGHQLMNVEDVHKRETLPEEQKQQLSNEKTTISEKVDDVRPPDNTDGSSNFFDAYMDLRVKAMEGKEPSDQKRPGDGLDHVMHPTEAIDHGALCKIEGDLIEQNLSDLTKDMGLKMPELEKEAKECESEECTVKKETELLINETKKQNLPETFVCEISTKDNEINLDGKKPVDVRNISVGDLPLEDRVGTLEGHTLLGPHCNEKGISSEESEATPIFGPSQDPCLEKTEMYQTKPSEVTEDIKGLSNQ